MLSTTITSRNCVGTGLSDHVGWSVLIAHLYPRDPHHQKATECLREGAGQGFVIHSLNLAEVLVGGVKAGRGREMLSDTESTLATFDDALAKAARQYRVAVAPEPRPEPGGAAI